MPSDGLDGNRTDSQGTEQQTNLKDQLSQLQAGKSSLLYAFNTEWLDSSEYKKLLASYNRNAANKNGKTLQHQINEAVTTLAKKHQKDGVAKVMERYDLLDAFDSVDEGLLRSMPDDVYYFVLDHLEVPVEAKEVVAASLSKKSGTKEILSVIKTVASQTESKRILSITASSRDPYESADFYQGFFAGPNVVSQWLPLTPALAKAIMAKDCANLDAYRQAQKVYNRETIYPEHTRAERELCEKGIEHLRQTIREAGVVMLNGGDQSLTRQAFFADDGSAYPWLIDLLQVPMLAGTSAGSAVQSGGVNEFGVVPMISNGTSIQSLVSGAIADEPPSARCAELTDCSAKRHPEQVTYLASGGIGSFDLGVVDTHFSERNRSVRLFKLLSETGQARGFGVDETTALLVANGNDSTDFAVLGQSGVVVIEPEDESSFLYSYWPSGTQATLKDNQLSLKQGKEVEQQIKLSLPKSTPRRFEDILQNGKLRSLTQVMCMTNLSQAEGIQQFMVNDAQQTWLLNAEKTENTKYQLLSTATNRCAIEKLKITLKPLNTLF